MRDKVRWQVGVLRRSTENVAWTCGGTAADWATARTATIAAVHELVAVEGRHEYRFRIDDAEGIVNPGMSTDGDLLLGDLERLIPADKFA